MASVEVNRMLAAAAAACEDKKAEDIRILALDPAESGLSDFFLICNGTNDRQNVAITDEIEIRLKRDFGTYPNSVEGRRNGEWILMDYVDFIVHVFSPEKRAYYGLERLRKTATTLSVGDLNTDIKQQITQTRSLPSNKTAATKSTAKRAAGKSAAEKTPPKKAASKKTAARKSAAKTTAAKTTAAKKTAAKTTAAKQTSAVRKTKD